MLLSLGVALLFLHDFVLVPLHADARPDNLELLTDPPLQRPATIEATAVRRDLTAGRPGARPTSRRAGGAPPDSSPPLSAYLEQERDPIL